MSGEKKWTPGPWKLGPCSHGGEILIRGEYGRGVEQSHVQIVPSADAHLIAAAPDLYEQLDYVRMSLMSWYPNSKIREELIEGILELQAKARGEK